MSSASPSPTSPAAVSPPASSSSTPSHPSFPPPNSFNSPPASSSSPPSQLSTPPPNSWNSPSHAPPPHLSPLPVRTPSAPAPQLNASLSDPPGSPLPQMNSSPPTVTPPQQQSPPPSSVTPPLSNARPPASSPPFQPSNPPPTLSPPLPNPPTTSPSPPLPSSPPSSPPPVTTKPLPPPSSEVPESPPPPSLKPPNNSPPPPTTKPPEHSPPPPQPPFGASLPPSLPKAPENSPPLPSAKPPQNSQLQPPQFVPPHNSPSRPVPPASSPTTPFSNSPLRSSPPPLLQMSPPPPSFVSLRPPSPPSHGNPSDNISSRNAPKGSQSTNGGGIGTGGTVAVAVVLGLVLLSIFGIAACCVWKRKKRAGPHNGGYILPTSVSSTLESDNSLRKVQMSAPSNRSGSSSGTAYSHRESGGLGNSRSWFTYEELVVATNGFSTQNLLGEGGFGSVYKGTLTNGKEVAVKQLKIGGGQGDREFRSEVEIISRIHHRHLVSLVGYCISDDKRLLVYDYLPNNTLYFHLHGEGRPVMDWATRVKIAVGAARGIAYLHEDCHPRIIHRDIKSSNILLDNNFEARVSDFGLAKLAIDTHVTTRVMGTFGYMAPEYASSGKLTEKSDVYSYGVVLLELITGRKPVDTSQPPGEESLVEWARTLLSHAIETQEFKELADPRLEGNYIDGEMFRLIEAAAACVRHSSTKRPKMGQVVRAFNSMATADLTNGMRLGESELFNSTERSEEIRLFQRMAFDNQNYSTNFFLQNSHSSEANLENSPTD